jgi:hypothetical protein
LDARAKQENKVRYRVRVPQKMLDPLFLKLTKLSPQRDGPNSIIVCVASSDTHEVERLIDCFCFERKLPRPHRSISPNSGPQ